MDPVHCGCGNAILENTGVLNGGCGEGTIFTFTSGHKPTKLDEKLVVAPNSNGGSQSQETSTMPPEGCPPPRRYHSRRSRSPCRIRIDFKDLLARNGTRGAKLRSNFADDKAGAAGQNGIDRRKLDWNDKAKQLADLFDSRKPANLGLQKAGKMHVVHGTVLPAQTVKPLNVEVNAVKDQTDLRLTEMASKIREQEACREALAKENALLREQLERIKSGELSRHNSSAQGQAPEMADDTMILASGKAQQQPNRCHIRKEKLRRSKGDGTDDRKNRLSMEKLLGERSAMIDKRRSMKAWLKSGYFDFSGANHASPMARSFISFKAGLSSVGRKPYILRFKRRDKIGPKAGKVATRNRKEDCNGHDFSTVSEDFTAWTEAPSLTSQLRTLASSLPEFSPTAVIGEPWSSCDDKHKSMQPEDCDKEVASSAVKDIGHSSPITGTVDDEISLPHDEDELRDQEKRVQVQGEDQGVSEPGSDKGTEEEESSAEECQAVRNRQELQISAWVSGVLAAVEAKVAHRQALEALEDKELKLEAAGVGTKLETGPRNSPPSADLTVLEYEPLKENGAHAESEVKVVETKLELDETRHGVQATGIKAMLKDFRMKERLSRLRRMPILFRPKNSSAYSWLRLSRESKNLMLQQVATDEVLKREIGFPHKQGKSLDLQPDHINFNGGLRAAAKDDGSLPCIAQPLKECQCDNEIGQEKGIGESGHSQKKIIVQCPDNYSDTADSTLCVGDCKDQEAGELMTCCSGFGSFGREKIHAVEDDKKDSVQALAKPAIDPTIVTLDKQDGARSIFGRRKMRAIMNFRKDREQGPVSNCYSYTSLSLIVGNEKKTPNTAKVKSAVKLKLKGYDSSQEAEWLSDTVFPGEDADSQHDSDDGSSRNPGSRGEKCIVATQDPPLETASSYQDATSGRFLQDTQKNGKRDSSDSQIVIPTTEDYDTSKIVQVPDGIVPAEQVFLARFSTMSVDGSRQSFGSFKTDPTPAESSSLSALSSLLLPHSPKRSTEVPLSEPDQSAYVLGVRCSTAPCPSLSKDDQTLYEPFDLSGRPTTASGNCLQNPKTIPRNYNPPPHSCDSSFFHDFPRTETVVPAAHHHSGYHLCSQAQGTCFPVCPKQSIGLETPAFPESCGPLISRAPTHLPHHLALHHPCLAHPWVCYNQQQGRPRTGTSHPLGRSCESLPEHCQSEISLNHDKDPTHGSLPKVAPSFPPWPPPHPVHSKLASSGLSFISHRGQGYDVESITQPEVSRPLDYPTDIEFSLAHTPSVVPPYVPSTHQGSMKSVQPSVKDSAYPQRQQGQVGHKVRSFPGHYHATQPPGNLAEDFGSIITSAPLVHSLQEPKEEVLGTASTVGNSTPHQMLWLSEEETEIIRQIRVSREKGAGPSPYSSLIAEQGYSAMNPKNDGFDTNEVITAHHRRTISHGSNLSASSADDSVLPFDDGRSTKDVDANWKKLAEHDNLTGPAENKRQLAIVEKQTKMVIAACRQSAAACIQKWWKRCMHQKAADLEQYHLVALKLSEMPGWLHHFPDSKLRSAATVSRVRQRRKWVQKRYIYLRRAAITIQRWWRNLTREMACRPTSLKKLPNSMKGFYNLVKSRHLSRGVIAPTYDRFLKLMERVQAATEGARVRNRLKSRRLQAMIMEIKEIRALLVEMAFDNVRDTPPNLIPQLYNQLQQKLLQLRTALTGPEKDARFVLRRSPASPLVIYTTRPTQSAITGGAGQRTGDQVLLKSSTSSLAETLNAVSLQLQGDKFNVISPPKRSHIPSSTLLSDQNINRPVGRKFVDLAYAQIYQQKDSGFLSQSKKADEELQRFSQTEPNMHQIQIQLQSSAGSEEQFYETEYVDQPDRPKRPYLKRKSIMMAPQKLDWSQVKPMVRSRLEPELKTKLIQNKSNGVTVSSTSRKVVKNYTKVKSRLFNYERKGSSFEASANSSKAAAGDADLSEFAEVRQWNETRKLERAQKALIKNCDMTKKSNNVEYSASDNMSTGGKVQAKTLPAPRKLAEGSQQKAEEKGGKSRQHSNRYGSTGDLSQKAQKEILGHHTSSEEMGKPFSAITSKQGWVASVELENMFKGVISLKNEKGISLNRLFQPIQDKSVVPQLNPSAHILNTSVDERHRMFAVLWNEERSNRVQPHGSARS